MYSMYFVLSRILNWYKWNNPIFFRIVNLSPPLSPICHDIVYSGYRKFPLSVFFLCKCRNIVYDIVWCILYMLNIFLCKFFYFIEKLYEFLWEFINIAFKCVTVALHHSYFYKNLLSYKLFYECFQFSFWHAKTLILHARESYYTEFLISLLDCEEYFVFGSFWYSDHKKKKYRLGHFFSSITQAILERLANSSANLSYLWI